MKDYNHSATDISEATGVDVDATVEKAYELYDTSGEKNSEFVEVLEKSFNSRELAIMSGLFIIELLEQNEKKEQENNKVKVIEFSSDELPEEVRNFLAEKLKSEMVKRGIKELINPESLKVKSSKEEEKERGITITNVGEGGNC